MFRLIVEKELRDITGDSKFVLSFCVCSVLIILSFYAAARTSSINQSRYDASRRENLRTLEGITDWREVQQTRVFLPPMPLAALVAGISNDIGQNATIQGRDEIPISDSRYGDDPVYAVFRFLDLDFIFQIVLSLFAILLAYDAISGEKERGTLRLTFSNSVSRATYLLGTMTGCWLALAVPLVIPFLIGILVFTVSGTQLTGDEWVRLLLIIGTGFLLFGVYIVLSVFVSALTRRSSSSFLILLVVWVLTVMVIPRISAMGLGRLVDVPTEQSLQSLKSRYNASIWNENRKKMAAYQPTVTGDPQKLMQEFQQFMSSLSDNKDRLMKDFSGKLNQDRNNRLEEQASVSLAGARLSPAAAFSLAAGDLAGTGLSLKQLYRKQCEEYQTAYAHFMVEKTGFNSGGGIVMRIVTDGGEKPKPINPAELPAFQFTPPPLGSIIPEVLPEWGVLVVMGFLFVAGAFAAFLRYDLR